MIVRGGDGVGGRMRFRLAAALVLDSVEVCGAGFVCRAVVKESCNLVLVIVIERPDLVLNVVDV